MSEKWLVETAEETDGRWFAEVTNMPGVMAYAESRIEAIKTVILMALLMTSSEEE